jgi:serine/threonine protein kinase
MAVVYKPGQKVRHYEIVRELNRGAFANAYEARSLVGERIFFKQYKSPSRLVDWYKGFVEHQKEIKRRIESDAAAKDRCYRFIEFFEDKDFFQAFEFVEGGKPLTDCLAERDKFSWDQMAIFAKVMMFGIKGLHQVKIVHTDLKPDNIILIPDATIGMGFKLRVIDLDWAIFADKQPPWHGKQGYIGTPGYQSPEHLTGKVPTPASDIFTCGIMLGEVLGNGHPFASSGADGYNQAAVEGRFAPIHLHQPIDKVADAAFLEAVLNGCLNPNPDKRPTAAQVCDALLGKTFDWHGAPASRSATSSPPPSPRIEPSAVPGPREAIRADAPAKAVEMLFDGKRVTQVSVDAEFGKQTFKALHADAQFMSNPQFKLFRRGNIWMIEHCQSATNETLVDGRKLAETEPVRDGMRVAVGNSAKGIEKFPLQLQLLR